MDERSLRSTRDGTVHEGRLTALDAHCALAQVHFDMYGTLHMNALREPAEPVDVGALADPSVKLSDLAA